VYYGLDPGTFDLKDYLKRKDGSSTADLPALQVEIRTLLPPGQVQPHELTASAGPALGGYRFWLVVGGVVWGVGLLAIVFVGRQRRRAGADTTSRPVTLAARLRPLVEQARVGALSIAERAELERLLLTFWQRRLGVAEARPQEVFATLRQHAEAGPLLVQLERWLHRPGAADNVDVATLLAPYAAADDPEPPLAA
jgi:hypothetical protein